jgi:hypothetical protein
MNVALTIMSWASKSGVLNKLYKTAYEYRGMILAHFHCFPAAVCFVLGVPIQICVIGIGLSWAFGCIINYKDEMELRVLNRNRLPVVDLDHDNWGVLSAPFIIDLQPLPVSGHVVAHGLPRQQFYPCEVCSRQTPVQQHLRLHLTWMSGRVGVAASFLRHHCGHINLKVKDVPSCSRDDGYGVSEAFIRRDDWLALRTGDSGPFSWTAQTRIHSKAAEIFVFRDDCRLSTSTELLCRKTQRLTTHRLYVDVKEPIEVKASLIGRVFNRGVFRLRLYQCQDSECGEIVITRSVQIEPAFKPRLFVGITFWCIVAVLWFKLGSALSVTNNPT